MNLELQERKLQLKYPKTNDQSSQDGKNAKNKTNTKTKKNHEVLEDLLNVKKVSFYIIM